MKKNVLLLLLLLAGCAVDERNNIDDVSESYQAVYITVTASVDEVVETRGIPVNAVSQMDDLGLFCSYSGDALWDYTSNIPDKIYNMMMVRNAQTGSWDYFDTSVPWDNATAADNYTFFAYAPYAKTKNGITVTSSANTAGIPALRYTVPPIVQDQPDLMLAVPKENIHPTGHPVDLRMRHALTAVGFMVYGYGTVTAISVTGVHVGGDLLMDGSNIVWSIASGSVTALDFTASILGNSFTADSETPQNLLADDGYLMMIPQTLTEEAKVNITINGVTKALELHLATPQWQAGKKVIYSINLSPGL